MQRAREDVRAGPLDACVSTDNRLSFDSCGDRFIVIHCIHVSESILKLRGLHSNLKKRAGIVDDGKVCPKSKQISGPWTALQNTQRMVLDKKN